MKYARATIAYPILILSGSMLDVQILALLAMPVYLVGGILFIAYMAKLVNGDDRKISLDTVLIILGTILISVLSAYGAVEFSETNTGSRTGFIQQMLPLREKPFALIAGGLALGSLMILLGLIMTKQFTRKKVLMVWIPTLLVFPVIILLIFFWASIGFPVGSG